MPRFLRTSLLAGLLGCALSLGAQTWTPKTIRFEGAPSQDQAQLITLIGLKPGTAMSKEEIEAGLQKLADTGSFTDLSYTVNAEALVIKLSGSEDTGQAPVRFANFLWWQPTDLEHLVETEVPLYHGELSLTGTLTTQVEATLVSLLQQKGVTAKVDALRDKRGLVLAIEQPSILVGNVAIDEAQPRFGRTMAQFRAELHGQDVDVATTSATIQHDGAEIFRNAGYLDARIDAPAYSTPHPAAAGAYAVDITAAAHPGELYRVTKMNLVAAAPLSESALRGVAELHAGDLAAPMGLAITGQKCARLYQNLGYLDAEAQDAASVDHIAHTAEYTVTMSAGELYHLAGIDASALPADLQAALAQDKRLSPGVPAEASVGEALAHDAHDLYPGRVLAMTEQRNRQAHTVTYVLQFAGSAPRR
jgi:outer membrane protein assembly factor BamA